MTSKTAACVLWPTQYHGDSGHGQLPRNLTPNNYSAIMDSLLQEEASSNVQEIYEQLKV